MSFLTQYRSHNVMMPDKATPRLRGWHFLLFNLVLGLAHMAVLFNAASYIAFLPHVAGDLGGVLPSFGTWAQTDFMIALALAFPIARWLSDRFGESRVFIGACLAYAAASYLCAVSDSLALFLPARVLLGFAGGITLPIGQALLLREYPDRLKSVALGVWGFFTLMPFTIGLPIGGWIADELGWRYLFYLNVPVAMLIAGVTWALMTGRPFELRRLRFDYIGFLLLALILGGIQTILNEGNDFDWWDSYVLRGLLLMVVIAVPCWIIWEWEEADPAVDLRLFRSRNFAIGLIGLTAGFFALQGLLSLFVVHLQLLMGYIAKRKGQVGDRVKPGVTLMTIVPMEHLWVEANLRETELRDVRPGQPALVTVDLHGRKQMYHGTVEGLVPGTGTGSAFALLPPDNATGNFIHIVESECRSALRYQSTRSANIRFARACPP